MTTRPRPRDTHRTRFKWQRGLIVWLVGVFIASPGKLDTPAYPRVCSLLDYHYFVESTPFSFSFGESARRLSPPIFTVLFAMFASCFFGFSFAFRLTCLCCFSSRSRILFCPNTFDEPSQTARRRRCRRGQSIVASNDKRVRPYRCRFAAFSRSITPVNCRKVWQETTFTWWPWMMF